MIYRNCYLRISICIIQIRKTLTLLFVTILASTLFHIGFISNPSISIPPQFVDEPFVLGPIAGLSENKNDTVDSIVIRN